MKTISIPTNDRPDLLRETLASVREALAFSEGWTLIFNCEPVAKVVELARSVNWAPVYFHQNPVKAGCRVNTFLAVEFAFACGSELNLYLEDDVVLARDALTLADAFVGSGVEGVLCLRRWDASQTGEADGVRHADHGLLGDGFAIRARDWPWMRGWWFHDHSEMGGAMWDWSVSWALSKQGIRQWRPMVQRSQNVGRTGTHSDGASDPNHFSPCYRGEPVQRFHFYDTAAG